MHLSMNSGSPGDRDAARDLHNRAVARYQAADRAGAAALLGDAVAADPDCPEAHASLGVVLRELGRLPESRTALERAAQLAPHDPECQANLGVTLYQMQEFDRSLDHLERAAALGSENSLAFFALGLLRHRMRRHEAALDAYGRAIELDPRNANAWLNRGAALHRTGRSLEALAHFDRVADLRGADSGLLVNRAAALARLGRFDEALADYAQAQSLGLRDADVRYPRSLILLLRGDLTQGWLEHESRWERTGAPSRRHAAITPWRGEPLAGRRILLWSEQGYGDTVQFCRYALALKAQGAEVILDVQRPLTRLLASLDAQIEVIAEGAPPPRVDFQAPLLSLPLLLGTRLETIPAPVPYLQPDPQRLRSWHARLPAHTGRIRVGLAVAGNPEHLNDGARSAPLAALVPLAARADVFLLQKEIRDADRVVLDAMPAMRWMGGELQDFADTAALAQQLDLIISVDTSLAHVAGALGKPGWLLLPRIPDWRWMMETDLSPWYPTLRLFRQQVDGDWAGVVRRVLAALDEIGPTLVPAA